MRNSLRFALLLALGSQLSALSHAASIIPDALIVPRLPGTDIGVIGGIPTNLTQASVLTPTGNTTNRQSAIQSAINAAASGTFVLLNTEGANTDYTVGSTITLKTGVELRLAPGARIVYTGTAVPAIRFGSGASGDDWPWGTDGPAITANASKGAVTVTLGTTAAFSVGQLVVLSQDKPDFAADPSLLEFSDLGLTPNQRRQINRVTAKTGTQLTLAHGLYTALTTARTARVHAVINTGAVMHHAGLRGGTIDLTASTSDRGVDLIEVHDCWVLDTKVVKASNYNFYLDNCLNVEVRHCTANEIKNAGSNGAGLLVQRASAWLIEDNIVRRAFPLIEINHGCSNGVFAYNYCDDSTSFTIMGAALDTNHGPHNSFIVLEGNWASNAQSDCYFGSESEGIWIRNRLHGTNENSANSAAQKDYSRAVQLGRFAYQMAVVGNTLGMPQSFWTTKAAYTIAVEPANPSYTTPIIYARGFPNMGSYGATGTASPRTGDFWADWPNATGQNGYQEKNLDVAFYSTVKGNANAVDNGIPAGESLGASTLPDSVFRTTKPDWFGSRAWPAYPPTAPIWDLVASAEAIPAGYRALHNDQDPPASSGTAPAAPSAPGVTANSTTQITLTWTDNSSDETGFAILRGTVSGALTEVATVSAGVTSYPSTALLPNTAYFFTIKARNSSGDSAATTEVTATTAATAATTTTLNAGQIVIAP